MASSPIYHFDTCECKVQIFFDDDLNITKREFVSRCGLHKSFTAEQVHEENMRKNNCLRVIGEQYPEHKELAVWSFDKDRNVKIRVLDASPEKAILIQESLKAEVGHDGIVVTNDLVG